ncbi:MAG: diaminopimelate epimerase [Magnetococcales bacterium]|nr:diaminopimelate epimerase [Magnetococcales bacterium]
MPFVKMHGLGNDFVLLDNLNGAPLLSESQARFLADRRLGIGCDQVVQLLPAQQGCDVRMVIFNPDGSQAEMCGNAVRCLGRYLWQRRAFDKQTLSVETLAGDIRIIQAGTDLISVEMGQPVLVNGDDAVSLSVNGADYRVTEVSMGNPHCVIFDPSVEDVPLAEVGPLIENHQRFPNRTNVEFVSITDNAHIRMRVWERGAGITPACGTGACASAVAAMVHGHVGRHVSVELDGGILDIQWRASDDQVIMTGTATHVFDGEIRLSL